MNRAERRRSEREHATPDPRITYAPGLKKGLGQWDPKQTPGEHLFVATTIHNITTEGAWRAMEGEQVLLDPMVVGRLI